ncbi:MAG: hypothetical protein C0613_14335 [Desulfobulbaceae bacterium]|nr:MAG: hypothetical protein C0613_14335 [Desulfobulbaceae bacterium]
MGFWQGYSLVFSCMVGRLYDMIGKLGALRLLDMTIVKFMLSNVLTGMVGFTSPLKNYCTRRSLFVCHLQMRRQNSA